MISNFNQTLLPLGLNSFGSIFTDVLSKTRWVRYCKPPFGGAAQVLDYLGRYTHCVAISNTRILPLQDNQVSIFKERVVQALIG